ncbi:MAG TPA: protein kinase [Elusimicrobiota bacterium]|nr:protein kinase [Elusimicrobiota bacterium]
MPPERETPVDATLRQESAALEESQGISAQAPDQHPDAPKIPGYVLTAPIGRGAYAQVWKAWQARTRKMVAVKVFHRQEGVDWLFLQREVERLIRLDKHPNVVSLLDANLTGDPAYYVMDLMEGGSLQSFLDSGKRPSVEQSARWMEDVAKALSWVHAKGVIHCDLKPANLLIDDEGRLRVADFGQSRIVSDAQGALGTLYYMAPEQAMGSGQSEILYPDVRWDVFALGATFYAALSGEPPRKRELEGALEGSASLAEKLKSYREGIERTPAAPLAKLSGGAVDEDLSAVVETCIKPWVEQRYADAGAVARDLEARRGGYPVSPLAGSASYRAKKFLKRNRALAVVCAVALLALSGAARFAYHKHLQALAERRQALDKLALSYALRAEQYVEKEDDPVAAAFYLESYRTSPSHLAMANALAYGSRIRDRPTAALRWHGVRHLAFTADGARLIAGGDSPIGVIELSPTPRIAEGIMVDDKGDGGGSTRDGMVHGLPPTGDGRIVRYFDERTMRRIALEFPPGRIPKVDKLAVLSAVVAGTPLKPPPDGPEIRLRLPADLTQDEANGLGALTFLAVSPDFSRLLIADWKSARLWDVRTGRPYGPKLAVDASLTTAIFSPDGRLALTAGEDGLAQVWDAASGRPVGAPLRHGDAILSAAFSNDSSKVLTSSADMSARLWSVRDGGLLAAFRHHGAVASAAFSPDGRKVVTASEDGTARVWDAASARPTGRVLRHTAPLTAAAFGLDGRRIATADREGNILFWDDSAEPEPERFVLRDPISSVGSHFAAFDWEGQPFIGRAGGVRYYDRASAAAGAEVELPGASEMTLSADGRVLAFSSYLRPEVEIWDWTSRKALRSLPHRGGGPIALSPDGKLLLTIEEKDAVLWDAASGGRLLSMPYEGYSPPVAFGTEGRAVIGSLILHLDAVRKVGERVAVLRETNDGAFKPIYNSSPAPAEIRILSNGRIVGPKGQVLGLALSDKSAHIAAAFSPDGRTAAIGTLEGIVRIWDCANFTTSGKRLSHSKSVTALAFSPDGKTLLTGSHDRTIRLWDVASEEPIAWPMLHDLGGFAEFDGEVNSAAFSRDGTRIAVATPTALYLWKTGWLETPKDPSRRLQEEQSSLPYRVGGHGELEALPPPSRRPS